ncbi:MAG TPA: hypothetical protein VLL07_06175, partial [Pontiella sp.]|nr:hypothetical protein [Pontiella sp.]
DLDNQLYTAALDRAPEDTYLVANYAQFLDGTGKSAEAIDQAERFCALLPDLAWPHHYRALVLAKAGRREEAKQSLRKALEIRSDYTQARDLLEQLR